MRWTPPASPKARHAVGLGVGMLGIISSAVTEAAEVLWCLSSAFQHCTQRPLWPIPGSNPAVLQGNYCCCCCYQCCGAVGITNDGTHTLPELCTCTCITSTCICHIVSDDVADYTATCYCCCCCCCGHCRNHCCCCCPPADLPSHKHLLAGMDRLAAPTPAAALFCC